MITALHSRLYINNMIYAFIVKLEKEIRVENRDDTNNCNVY